MRRMTQRVELDSSAIEAVKYDQNGQTLDVEFREGYSYRYMGVPGVVYHALLNADLAGAFGIQLRIDSIT